MPTSLGELRQAILAVVVGNKLFSPEEQLQLNHATHEHADPIQLLHHVQHEASRRAAVARLKPRYDRALAPRATQATRMRERRLLLEGRQAILVEKQRYLHLMHYLPAINQVRAMCTWASWSAWGKRATRIAH